VKGFSFSMSHPQEVNEERDKRLGDAEDNASECRRDNGVDDGHRPNRPDDVCAVATHDVLSYLSARVDSEDFTTSPPKQQIVTGIIHRPVELELQASSTIPRMSYTVDATLVLT
jgi:hypothetical protein